MRGLIGRKVGMTQIFNEAGARVPVTVIDVGGNIVLQKKSGQDRDGYTAVKLGFEKADRQEKNGMVRFRGANAPETGVFLKAGIEVPYRHVREFRVNGEELDGYEVGKELLPEEHFQAGQYVDVTGTSKGKGYTGVIKRHGFSRPKMTHGTHEFFRHGGAIGMSADPSKVQKGKKMPGQHGNARSTVQNLQVVEVLPEEGVILIKGAVPGPSGGIVLIRQAVKRKRAAVAAS